MVCKYFLFAFSMLILQCIKPSVKGYMNSDALKLHRHHGWKYFAALILTLKVQLESWVALTVHIIHYLW